jgi:hypothetical protein
MLFAHRREVLPAELAGSAGKLAHDNRFRLLRQGRVWCPPALVLWAAARYTGQLVTVAALNADGMASVDLADLESARGAAACRPHAAAVLYTRTASCWCSPEMRPGRDQST